VAERTGKRILLQALTLDADLSPAGVSNLWVLHVD